MDEIELLEKWYYQQCDESWEHQYGVAISTLDNPGWRVKIDLSGTSAANIIFNEVAIDRSEDDWVRCRVVDKVFDSAGGPRNLSEIIKIFLDSIANK